MATTDFVAVWIVFLPLGGVIKFFRMKDSQRACALPAARRAVRAAAAVQRVHRMLVAAGWVAVGEFSFAAVRPAVT
eukprot:SAG31_NODE_24646_length_477_cov_0.804233_1_plen_75_part_10